MSKTSILTKFSFLLLFLTVASLTQAQTITDPCLSRHNYKMQNKAVQAKIEDQGQFVVVMNALRENQLSSVSKYAVRTASIVMAINDKKAPMSINPLVSVSNYKTQPAPKMQTGHDEYSASLN